MWRAMLWVVLITSSWFIEPVKGMARNSWSPCNNIVDTPGLIQPMGETELLMHDNLTITCLLHPEQAQNLGVNASNLRLFRYSDEVKPNSTHKLEIVNETALQLQLIDVQPSTSEYNCYLLHPENSRTKVCSNVVVVGTFPQNITNFHCESNNWSNLTCTWSPDVVNYVRTGYQLQIKYAGRSGHHSPSNCPKIEKEKGSYKCSWNSRSLPAYRQGVESFKFELTGFNKFGNNLQVFWFNHFANVRPAPPVDLRVVNLTSHTATLLWSIPYQMFHFPKNLVHKIVYCSELDELMWKETQINPPVDQRHLSFDLELPYANIRYDVRVFIKVGISTDEMWSNFSAITFKTESKIPEKPPKMDIGSFESVAVGSTRKVYIYWQQIERFEENGDNFSYSIVHARTNTEQVLLTPTEVTNSYMFFDKLTLDRIEIHIKSKNSVGLSVNETVMIIPGSKEIFPKPSPFTKIKYEQGLYELSWTNHRFLSRYLVVILCNTCMNHPDLESYTIFWCINNRDTFRCENKIQWETVPKDISVKNISVGDDSPYHFAISANSKNSSSGMVWAQYETVH